MNDDHSIDPALQPLEAQLTALRPKLPDREAQELLYRCAFAAGARSASKRTRRWQVAAAAAVVLTLGMSISLFKDREPVALLPPTTVQPGSPVQVATPPIVAGAFPGAAAGSIDAWQVRSDTAETFETALARFKQLAPNSRSLAVGAMTRASDVIP